MPVGRYILLLDIRMPKVDGVEVLRLIKEDHRLRKIPVVMLTTTKQETEIDRCYEFGCRFYLPKPSDYHQFMRVVENIGKLLCLKSLRVPVVNGRSEGGD